MDAVYHYHGAGEVCDRAERRSLVFTVTEKLLGTDLRILPSSDLAWSATIGSVSTALAKLVCFLSHY